MQPATWSIHHFDEIDSTNRWVKNHKDELPSKTAVVADFQSAGRGRLGRSWIAPAGSALMVSLLLRPNWPVERAAWLMMMAGTAVAQTLTDASEQPIQLKWPNDIVVERNGAIHKLGGILSEVMTDDGRLTEAIIGIGINVNMTAGQLPADAHTPACSLATLTGRTFKNEILLGRLLNNFEAVYTAACAGRSPQNGWQSRLITIGRPVTATMVSNKSGGKAQKIEGVATGVDGWGRLLITTQSGRVTPVSAGDVTLRSG